MIAKLLLLLAAVIPAFAQDSWWPPLNKADVNRHWYMFRTLVGAPTGTGILIEPFRSLREIDPFLDDPGKPFENTFLSAESPEIGIFTVNTRASYPK
jgi:hypothetical protein